MYVRFIGNQPLFQFHSDERDMRAIQTRSVKMNAILEYYMTTTSRYVEIRLPYRLKFGR